MSRGVGETGSEGGPGTIGVTLTLFGDMKRYSPAGVDGPHRRAVPVGSTVAALLEALGVPADADVTVGVDGEMADRATASRRRGEEALAHEGGSAPLLHRSTALVPRIVPDPSPSRETLHGDAPALRHLRSPTRRVRSRAGPARGGGHGQARRAPGAREGRRPRLRLDNVEPQNVVEIELEDGLRLWSRVEDLQRDFASPTREAQAGVIDLPAYLPLGGPAAASPAGPSRG